MCYFNTILGDEIQVVKNGYIVYRKLVIRGDLMVNKFHNIKVRGIKVKRFNSSLFFWKRVGSGRRGSSKSLGGIN